LLREKKRTSLTVACLSEQEKRMLLYPIFAGIDINNIPLELVDQTVIKDLALFYTQGQRTEQHLLHIINYTITIFGEAVLAHMLAHPTTDVQVLLNRQAFVKQLLTDNKLFNAVDDILESVAHTESTLLSFWQKENEPTQYVLEKMYPKNYFRKNDAALEAWIRIGNINTVCRLNKDLLLYGMIGALKPNWTFIDNAKNAHKYKGLQKRWFGFKAGVTTSVNRLKTALKKAKKNKYGDYILVALKLISIKKGVDAARYKKKNLRYVQKKQMAVASLVRGLKKIKMLGVQYPVLSNGLQRYTELENIFVLSDVYSQDFYRLVHNLQKKTFKGKPSFFSHAGRILATNTLMIQEKNTLVAGIQLLGELDACMSIAKLYKKFESERVGYCFAEYTQSSVPKVELASFWNPLVEPTVVVPNNLILGSTHKSHNIILTGSNTAGKSTFLKGVMLNLLLAQSIGIVPAQKCLLTPFAHLKTSLNIADDISSGNSLFKAEVLRAKSLVETSNSLEKGGFGFFVIDELFSGTDAKDGADAACKIAQHLAQNSHSMFILATHYPQLTHLEKTTQGLCSNFKMEARTDKDGKVIRTFKIEPGVNATNVASNILKQEIDSLFNDKK